MAQSVNDNGRCPYFIFREKFLLLDLIQDIQLAIHIRAYVSLVNVISLKLLLDILSFIASSSDTFPLVTGMASPVNLQATHSNGKSHHTVVNE